VKTAHNSEAKIGWFLKLLEVSYEHLDQKIIGQSQKPLEIQGLELRARFSCVERVLSLDSPHLVSRTSYVVSHF
jgi:hypothetical protein